MLNDQHKDLVRSSFESDQMRLEAFIPEFYSRLFSINPEIRTIFPTDTARLESKMLASLTHVAEALVDTERLDAILGQLGEKHHSMQISDDNFSDFIQSFTGALASTLGPEWNKETHEAWTEFLLYIAKRMRFSPPQDVDQTTL
ncbi:globin domain-containing protein [Pseudophaeobacter sp.]|uniref:globin domain-containing protein n=1 Tax=Pseudophaeobacter sp. TaxID=1971739 RepID=UPI0040589A0C